MGPAGSCSDQVSSLPPSFLAAASRKTANAHPAPPAETRIRPSGPVNSSASPAETTQLAVKSGIPSLRTRTSADELTGARRSIEKLEPAPRAPSKAPVAIRWGSTNRISASASKWLDLKIRSAPFGSAETCTSHPEPRSLPAQKRKSRAATARPPAATAKIVRRRPMCLARSVVVTIGPEFALGA